ncbi:MAG: hypothetical protein H0W96_08315, partial [Solirubrobacterales bacterium]|nr:hypothetical protein [Solirubrobacterales bacterium]
MAAPVSLRTSLRAFALIGIVVAVAAAYGAAIAWTGGHPLFAVVPVCVLLMAAVFARPIVGIYVAVAAALLFEQWGIVGLDPITAQTHFFDNVSAFTSVDLRLSAADMLIALTLVAWLAKRSRSAAPDLRGGPVGYAIGAYLFCFVVGVLVGFARGGAWDQSAMLAELRGPVYFVALYFLATNLLRTRRDVMRMLVLML